MKRVLVSVFIFSFLFLSACSPAQNTKKPLRIAVLPVLDSLPIYAAQDAGYFEQAGVTVEIIQVSSAPERDQLMQSKQVDGMLSELVTTLYYNRSEPQIKIVRFARTASETDALFRILAARDGNIHAAADLKGVEIGISQGTVIEYVTDRILAAAGLTADEIKKIAVPKIADRTALLQSGELKAAVIPDPLASLLIQKGAILVADDTSVPGFSNSIYGFHNGVLADRPDDVKAFLIAVEKAVADINKDPAGFNKLLADQKLVSPEIIESGFTAPPFPTASVPDAAQFEDALQWAMDKGMVEQALKYDDNIDPSFLP